MPPMELTAAIVPSEPEPEFAEAAKFSIDAIPKSAEIRLSRFNENTTSTSTDAGVKEAEWLSKISGIGFMTFRLPFGSGPGSSPRVLAWVPVPSVVNNGVQEAEGFTKTRYTSSGLQPLLLPAGAGDVGSTPAFADSSRDDARWYRHLGSLTRSL